MKIAIYEIVHLDWLIPLASLLEKQPFAVNFFVHKKMKEDIENALGANTYASHMWTYIEEQPAYSLYQFLDQQVNLHGYDLFWLNTNDSKHLVFALLRMKHRKMKLLVNVHEINNFFRPSIRLSPKHTIRSISKKILSAAADAYIVNADKMKENIAARKLTEKPCYTVTPVYFRNNDHAQIPSNKFSVVIAGTVDERRRDYKTALLAWRKFIELKDPATDASLILAGNSIPYGKEIVKICSDDVLLKNTVHIYEHEIPELIFQQLVACATVLLSPLVSQTSTSDKITEEYGLTKTSGNMYDAIRHAKPCMVPRHLAVPAAIESSTIRYAGDTELADMLKNMSNNDTALENLYKNAKANSQKFTYESVRQKILNMLAAISAPQ